MADMKDVIVEGKITGDMETREFVYKENIKGYAKDVIGDVLGSKAPNAQKNSLIKTSVYTGTRAMLSNAATFDTLKGYEGNPDKARDMAYDFLGMKPAAQPTQKQKTGLYVPSDIKSNADGSPKTIKYKRE